MKTAKKFISGVLAALAVTVAAGCGTGATKDEQNSAVQNNGTAGGTAENSMADDGRNDDVNSVTNGTDKDNHTDAGNGAGGSEIDGDGDNVIDDAAQGAEDIGKDIVDGVEDVGEGAADVLDGNDGDNTNGSRETTTDNSGTKK